MKFTVKKAHSAGIEAAAADWIARRDAGLSAADLAEFQQWAADPRHARALARHDQAWGILDRPRQGGKAETVVAELRARAQRRRRHRAGATLASLALLITAAIAWRSHATADPSDFSHAANNTVVILPEKRTLADGSMIELNTGAEIVVDFSGPLRRVALQAGEAHFQVHADKHRPFVVTAGGIEVRAVGTAFSVQVGSRQVDVLVTEGQVAVEKPVPPAGPAPAAGPLARLDEPLVVAAGNRVVVDTEFSELTPVPTVMPVLSAELAARLAWRAARLEFTGTRLAEAVALMNRHNRIQFVVEDPALAEVEVSGFFRADNTDAFLHLLEGSLGLRAQRSGDTITLRKETPAGRTARE